MNVHLSSIRSAIFYAPNGLITEYHRTDITSIDSEGDKAVFLTSYLKSGKDSNGVVYIQFEDPEGNIIVHEYNGHPFFISRA